MIFACGAICSCSDSNDEPGNGSENSKKDDAYSKIITQYLDGTVGPTYTALAERTEALVNDIRKIKDNPSDAAVRTACNTFLEARAWWEKSEAFLFGAAADFGIDPHIDSWPLDRDGLVSEMKNAAHIESMNADDGDEWAGAHLGPELLGFHGIEYILFANGQPKAVASIPQNELIYAIAVAGDLRNKCFQLEVSWLGDKADAGHRAKVEELELNSTVNSSDWSYNENMLNAGKPGSTYRTLTDAVQAIADGCMTIVDEVGTQKIGKPHTGEDANYIESPYSQMSITDFYDNMVSVENAYFGGIEGKRNTEASLHAYIGSVNPAIDKECADAIANAKQAIKSMKAPFVEFYTDASARKAMDACAELAEVLQKVKDELAK